MKKFLVFLILSLPLIAQASVTVSVNGTNHTIPQTNEKGWGTNVTAWIQAISQYTLQPSGGSFTLTADSDFGANFGLKSAYYKSRATNLPSAGILRLGNTESIGWRNAANSGNLLLSANASDVLQYNGSNVLLAGAGSIVNADISNSAAIAYSKLNLTGAILNADLAGSIAYSKLSLSNSLVNADINSSAAIALSKLAPVTINKALVSNGSGAVSASSVTATELGYLSGVTSNIQTQLNAAAINPMDAAGQMIYGGASGVQTKLAAGSSGQILVSSGASAPVWTNRYADKGYIRYTSPSDFITTSGSFVTPNDSSYNTYTNGGLAVGPGTANDLGFKVSSLPAGTYVVTFSGTLLAQVAQCTYVLSDGATFGILTVLPNISPSISVTSLSGIFTYASTQTNIDFKMQLRRDSGSGNCYVTYGSQGWFYKIERVQ